MNKLFTILLIMAASASMSFAQGLTENYVSFDIRLAKGSLSPENGNLALSFTENSVRELSYELSKDFSGTESYTAFEIGFKWGKYKGMSYSLELSAPLSGQGKGKFGVSVGYNYPIAVGTMDILFRPSVGITTGETSLDIGSIDVDTTGIIIEDTDYIDREVGVSLAHYICHVNPRLETVLLFEQKFGVSLSVAYDIEVGNKAQGVNFIASDFDATSIDFANEYLDLAFNGTRPTENLFTSSGLTFAIGLSWYYNRE